MSSRQREKNCALCEQISNPLFRIQIQPDQDWQLICRSCYDRTLTTHPSLRYGGTWKAKKRH